MPAIPVSWQKCSMQWTWPLWLMWQNLGFWTNLNLRQGLSITIPNFCHISSAQWQTGPSVLKVWRRWKNLAQSSCLWARYSPVEQHSQSHPSQRQSPSGKQPLQPRVYTWVNTPCLFSQVSSGSLHTNSSSFPPVKGRITLRAAVLPGSRGGTQTLQMQ